MRRKYKKITVCVLFVFVFCTVFPPQSQCITVNEEEKLSREFMQYVMQNLQIIKDPYLNTYVNKIGQKVVSVLPPQPFTYHFYIVEEDVYNAFAGPAAHIFINSGLLAAMESEDELAGILGHEISHVSCRHISDMIDRSKKIGFATLAAIAAGIFLGIGGNSQAAGAVMEGSIAAGQSISLAYTRRDEVQADQVGLKYLADAGYSAKGLLASLKKIRSKTWFGTEQVPTYLMTHPATEDRIAYISSWIENNEKTAPPPPPDNSAFLMAQTRLVALYGEEDVALQKYETAATGPDPDYLAHYGYGLILARTGNLKESLKQLRLAIEKKAFDANILKDLGRVYFLNGQYETALSILESAINLSSDDPESLFFFGWAQLKLGRIKNATATFENLIEKYPDYNEARHLLSGIYYKQGKHGESSYYLGVYYNNKGDFKTAEFHLKNAITNLTDENKKHKAEEMLKDIREKVKKGGPPAK